MRIDKMIEKYLNEGNSYTSEKIGVDEYSIEGNSDLTKAIANAYEKNPKDDLFKYVKKMVKTQDGKRLVLKFDSGSYGKLKGEKTPQIGKLVKKIIERYW